MTLKTTHIFNGQSSSVENSYEFYKTYKDRLFKIVLSEKSKDEEYRKITELTSLFNDMAEEVKNTEVPELKELKEIIEQFINSEYNIKNNSPLFRILVDVYGECNRLESKIIYFNEEPTTLKEFTTFYDNIIDVIERLIYHKFSYTDPLGRFVIKFMKIYLNSLKEEFNKKIQE